MPSISGSPQFSAQVHAKVHIWNTRFGGEDEDRTTVGHAALQLMEGNNVLKTLSFRPRTVGTVFPLPAQNFSTLAADKAHEERDPDRTISIPLKQEQVLAMSQKVDSIKDRIQTGKMLYTLLPGLTPFPLLSVLNDPIALQELTRCPFSGLELRSQESLEHLRVPEIKGSHCTAAVQETLRAGGIDIPESRVPWRLSPTQMGDFLANRYPSANFHEAE